MKQRSTLRCLLLGVVVAVAAMAAAGVAHADKDKKDKKGKGTPPSLGKAPKLHGVKTKAVEVDIGTAPDAGEQVKDHTPAKLDFSRSIDPRADADREKKLSEKRVALIGDIDALLAKAGPRYAARPDRLYQKAELEWEEAKYRHFLALDQYKPDSGKPEPKPDFKAAVATYRQILAEHADFPQADEVRFHLGFALAEQQDDAAAIAVLEELVKKHPKSPYVPDARVAVGELYFAGEEMDSAVKQYRAVVDKFAGHALAPFARYKLGWTLYRQTKFQEAATEIIGAIEDEEAAKGKVRLTVRDQAMADLIIVWTETPGAWKQAAAWYEQKGGDQLVRGQLLRYAKVQVGRDQPEDATALLVWLTARDPAHADVVTYDQLRFEIVQRGRKIEPAEAEAQRLAAFYRADGAWNTVKKRAAADREAARTLGEQSAMFAAGLRHEQAQRTADKAAYEQAGRDYAAYLSWYPDGKQAPEVTFRLAEVELQLGRAGDAGGHYLTAARLLGAGPMAEDSAYKSVYSYAIAVREGGLADDAVPPPDAPAGKPAAAPLALAPAEQALVAAADAYLAKLPDSADAAEVRFIGARVLYLRLHLKDAAARFVDVTGRHPKSPRAADSAALALDCYNRLRDWPSLVAWSRKMIDDERFEHQDERALREIISGASAQAAVALESAGDIAGAANVLVAVVDDNPKSSRNPERLLTAAAYEMRAGDRRSAEKLYKRLIADHSQHEAATHAAFALAALYEARGDLAAAAATYEQAASLPRIDGSADAVYNAALLLETLGEAKKAAALYDRYTRDFADRADGPEVALRAAAALATAGGADRDAAIKRYLLYRKSWPKAREALAVEAAARACELLAADVGAGGAPSGSARRGGGARTRDARLKAVRAQCAAAIDAAKKAGVARQPASPLAAAASRAQLVLAELATADMDAVKLELPEATLVRRFDEKLTKLNLAATAYFAVADYGVPAWGAQAIVQLGEAMQRFARAVKAAPEPTDLTGDALIQYRADIADQAAPIEERALQAFAQVADLAADGTITPATAQAAAARRIVEPATDPWLGEAPAVVSPLPELR